jgi:chemotaxis protein CheX
MTTKAQDTIVNFLPAFHEAAREVFDTMVFMPVSPGEPTVKTRGMPRGYISSTISLTGENLSGNLSILFELSLATDVFRSMMGMAPEDEVKPEEIGDVVAELANMIAGGAKSRLQERGVNFKIGLPTVVVGEAHCMEPMKDVDTVVIPMKTTGGEFYMEVSF